MLTPRAIDSDASAHTRCTAEASPSGPAPTGQVMAQALTQEDELVVARCDLDLCNSYKRTTFNFDVHRQPRAYGMIVERKGVTTMADGTPVRPKG